MKFANTLTALALAITASAAPANLTQAANTAPTGDNTQLLAELAVLPTASQRMKKLFTDKNGKLLSNETISSQIVFDYNSAKAASGALGGRTQLANAATFPILRGLSISTAVVFLDACGINTPHVHPRASEMITVATGTLDFGMIFENGVVAAGQGSAEVNGRLTQYQGTVFPQGSIHYQANPTCEQTVYMQTLNSDDPGTNSVAQSFFGLNGGVVQASLGWPANFKGEDLELFRAIIPVTLAARVESCLETCGLTKR